MTSVTMVTNDSAALHTTKKTDSLNVKEVQGYPSSQTVKEQGNATNAPRKNSKQTAQQRRRHERRIKNETVLLNTRSGHDRRNAIGSQNEDSKENVKKTTGINVYT